MGIVSMAGLDGHCNSLIILSSVARAVHRKRQIIVVNPSNDNGDAFLQYLGYVRSPDRNSIVFSRTSLASVGISVGLRHHGVNVMFRRFGLFGGGAILRGVALTPSLITLGNIHNHTRHTRVGTSVRTGTRHLLRHLNLSR